MRRWFLSLAAILACLLGAPNAHATTVEPQPPELEESPILITNYRVDNGAPTFVQLYNDSSSLVSLDGWKLEFEYTMTDPELREATTPRTYAITLDDWILPEKNVVLTRDEIVENADASYEISMDLSLYDVTGLRLVPPAESFLPYVVEEIGGGEFTAGARYQLSKSDAGNYVTSSEFEVAPADEDGNLPPLYGGGLYSYPKTTPLRISEILANPANCGPLDHASNCREFIEIYNPTDQPVDLSQYRLRFGYGNDSAGIGNTVQLTGVLSPHAYYAVAARDDGEPLEITASGGSVWLEDAHGLKLYEATVYDYSEIGDNKGFSWARDMNNSWHWAVATPDTRNNFELPAGKGSMAPDDGLKPCDANQFRNPATNRCKLISTKISELKPCDPDQYRSPETNRCRKISTAGSDLKPCDPGEYRNPATNRCKSVKAASASLKPCKEGQERNPETNRCRNVTGPIPDAAFSPVPLAQTGQTFTGWWALGGVGTLAIGRLGWEWREEALGMVKKVAAFLTSGK